MAAFRALTKEVWSLLFCATLAAMLGCLGCNAAGDQSRDDDTCDFIIVGGGTAGLTLAARLAEVPTWKICVLDRGPLEYNMDGWYTNNYKFTSPYDPFWLTQSTLETLETNEHGYLSNTNKDGRMIYVPRFRGRGGTSRVYGAIARRASPAVLDLWPSGWKHDDLTPYYIKTEDHYCYYDSSETTGISDEDCRKWHGKDGPIQFNSQLEEAFQKFPRDMKYLCEDETKPWRGYAYDYNGPRKDRVSCSVFQQMKLRTDEDYHPTPEARVNRAASTARGSSFTGYYKYNPNKPHLLISATVTQIIFENGKAVGVNYLLADGGAVRTLTAVKEVIVAGGAFDTPHLLQVSGVGPTELMTHIGVDLVADNRHVGQHLWDHISVPYSIRFTAEADDLCCLTEGSDIPQVDIDGTTHNTEDLASINGPFSWILHYRSNVTRVPQAMADIQLYVMGNSKLFDETEPLCTDDPKEYHDNVGNLDSDEPIEGTIRIIDQWPEYRGYINAVTSNIFDKPKLEYNWDYTTDGVPSPEFVKVSQLVRDQIHLLREMFFGENVSDDLRALIVEEVAPGPDVVTDDELNEWMRGMLVSALHPTGTCKMPECADEFLRVNQVTNLRVCDASAFATQTDGNPVATLFAMGEKLGNMLKFQYLKYINVAIRKDLAIDVTNVKPEIPDELSASHILGILTDCFDATMTYETLSTGKDTSALVYKWSLVCGESVNQRQAADVIALLSLGPIFADKCGANGYPLFNRDEASSPDRETTPKHKSTPYVFIVWCQHFPEVTADDLWGAVGGWNGDQGELPGSKKCFTLNCQNQICEFLKFIDHTNRELTYEAPSMSIPVVDYVSTKKVVSKSSVSSSFMRTGSMIANEGTDWYQDVAGYLLENVYASSGRRYSHQFPPLNAEAGWWTETSDGLLFYEMAGASSGELIAAFDLDGTIIKTASGETFPVDENDWVLTSALVKPTLQSNNLAGIKNVIMSNQNGISTGSQPKGEWITKIEHATAELGVPMYVLAATLENKYRKPNTGMWEYFSCTLNQFETIDKTNAVYVGDAAGRPEDHSDSDRMFATNVGIDFRTPEGYFSVHDEL